MARHSAGPPGPGRARCQWLRSRDGHDAMITVDSEGNGRAESSADFPSWRSDAPTEERLLAAHTFVRMVSAWARPASPMRARKMTRIMSRDKDGGQKKCACPINDSSDDPRQFPALARVNVYPVSLPLQMKKTRACAQGCSGDVTDRSSTTHRNR